MTKSRQLAQFVIQTKYGDLPAPVVEKAKELMLHAWGVQLAGSTLPWGRMAYRYVKAQGGSPESTVLNYGFKTGAVNAAFANGTFGHGFEIDDNHQRTGIKGSCATVPALLAIGETRLSSGMEMILALALGYEVMVRAGLSLAPVAVPRGHHATGICGPIGAAAGVGKLLGFDEETMMNAIGVAVTHSAGISESPATGRGNVKRIFGGMAASSGVRAALLAREGIFPAETMLEGERGFCVSFGENWNVEALTDGLGTKWNMLNVHYKVYAQDGYIQPMSECMGKIMKKHPFKAEDVAEVQVGTNSHAMKEIVGVIREPKDLTSSQFSANFSLALFMVKGNATFHEYTEDILTDPRIIELSKKVHLYIDDEIEREFHRTRPRGAKVTVKLKSGETISEKVDNLHLMTPQEVDEKVRGLAKVVVSPEKAEQLIATVRRLEGVRDISTVVPLLTR